MNSHWKLALLCLAAVSFPASGAEPPPAGSAGPDSFAEVEKRARAVTLDAARRRLALWDVPETEIERLERTREPQKAFPLLAPRGAPSLVHSAGCASRMKTRTGSEEIARSRS